jgi:hypothetical protein
MSEVGGRGGRLLLGLPLARLVVHDGEAGQMDPPGVRLSADAVNRPSVRRGVSPRARPSRYRRRLHVSRHKQRGADDEQHQHDFEGEKPPDALPHHGWVLVLPHTLDVGIGAAGLNTTLARATRAGFTLGTVSGCRYRHRGSDLPGRRRTRQPREPQDTTGPAPPKQSRPPRVTFRPVRALSHAAQRFGGGSQKNYSGRRQVQPLPGPAADRSLSRNEDRGSEPKLASYSRPTGLGRASGTRDGTRGRREGPLGPLATRVISRSLAL